MSNAYSDFIMEVSSAANVEEFYIVIDRLTSFLEANPCDPEIAITIKKVSKIQNNIFSNLSQMDQLNRCKDRVIEQLSLIASSSSLKTQEMNKQLEFYLENFYLFISAMNDRTPHTKATLTNDLLSKIKVMNEYDLQFLLYSALKPLFPDITDEVTDFNGLNSSRYDLLITSISTIIETKCTRKSMTIRRLSGEISTDLVDYKAKHIYFLIFDKVRLIKDIELFKAKYNRNFEDKNVKVIVVQPIYL